MIGIQAVTMSMTAIGNETTAISGDIASWTIDTELEFTEFKEMIERRKEIDPPSKIAWYYRYWASMSAVRGQDKTFRTLEWDSQISQDPLFNKALKDKQDLTRDKPKGETVVNDSIIDSGALDMDLGGFLDGTMGEDGC